MIANKTERMHCECDTVCDVQDVHYVLLLDFVIEFLPI